MIGEFNLVGTLITAGAVIVSALIGFFSGRKKEKASTSLIEAELQGKIHGIYLLIISDTNKNLGYYIKLSEENSKKIEDMQLTIDAILEDVCVKKNCKYRIYHRSVQARRQVEDFMEQKEYEVTIKENTTD